MRKLYDFIIDTWGYVLGFLYWLRSLYTQYKYAHLNTMSRSDWRNLAYAVGKVGATTTRRKTVPVECGNCYRLKYGRKIRLYGFSCPEHGLV